MFKFSFRRDKDKEFRHIAHGLVPAASIAPKPAVPRTPPPRSPDPSPERPRYPLTACHITSSLQPPPDVFPLELDRWSEDLASQPHLFSTDQSEEELQDKDEEEVEDNEEEEGEEHVYQTLDRRQECTIIEPIYALPLKPKVRFQRQAVALWRVGGLPFQVPNVQAETQTQRQQMQKLVDENDALKLTVHRLNVELSRYQAKFRPLSKQESSRINSLPMTGPPPPWLLDMKYLSPLLLAYEDRMNEKDALLQAVEEEMKKLRFRVEEVVKENERLNDEIAKSGGVSPKDCHQLQQQAILVLQENQVLIDQLEVQHVKAKASYNRHHSEVSKVSKKLMLLEEEKQHLQEELEEIRREAQVNQRELQEKIKEVQGLQARLKDAVTWDEHNSIISKLRWQLEQEEARKRSEVEELLLKVSTLQKENKSLALQKTNLTVDIERMEADLELGRQANRRMTVLKRQKEEYVLKEVKARHYLGAVMSVAEQISKERDQLIHMVLLTYLISRIELEFIWHSQFTSEPSTQMTVKLI
uniref:Centrosomal protein 89 n=1 Tax=Myripristis murdjan TaxID=586833 RepID=A0A667Z3Z4_9TELE